MANQPVNQQYDEIDLGRVSRKMRGYASRVNDSFFDLILFLKKYFIILIVLLVGGYFAGKYLDSGVDTYTHKMYIIPNFGSVDYLYTKVEHLNSKIGEGDKEFLKNSGLADVNISSIEIEPVVDIYTFIEDPDTRNFELLKLMSENGDITTIMEDNVTSKNYKYHLLKFNTRGKTTYEQTAEPLLTYLNNSPYYKVIQQEAITSLQTEIATIDTTLSQINAILNDFSRSKKNGSNNLMYYNDNTQLDKVIEQKEELTKEQAKNKIDLINYTQIIKESSAVLNTKREIKFPRRYSMPLVLTALFISLVLFRAYYRSQVNKRKIIITE